MNIDNTQKENNEICERLYNNDLITFEKYLECVGQNEQLRTGNISDIHKYAVSNTDYDTANIYNRRLNIFSTYTKEPLYLAVINSINVGNDNSNSSGDSNIGSDSGNNDNMITLTTGIINQDDNIFVIEKVNESKIAIKHQETGNYISYDIPKLSVGITTRKSAKTTFIMKSFLVDGIIKYKFSLLKQDGSESDYTLVIKDDKLGIERDSTFTWDIINLEFTNTSELDTLLVDINTIKKDYLQALQTYNLIYNKKRVLESIIEYIENNVDTVFNTLRNLQANNRVQISITQIDVSQQDTYNLLNDNQIGLIRNKIELLNDELELAKTDLEMYKNKLGERINDIQIEIEKKHSEINTITDNIQRYNRTLMNNNIIVDINKFNNADDENAKAILKSEINREAGNAFNNKKTRVNGYFIVVIVLLLLVIITQISLKLFNVKKA